MVVPCGGICSAKKRASSPDQSGATSARAGAIGRTENTSTASTDIHARRLDRTVEVNQRTIGDGSGLGGATDLCLPGFVQNGGSSSSTVPAGGGGGCQSAVTCSSSRGSLIQLHQGLVLG